MSARIPNYRLQQVHDENPEFHVAQTITMWDAARLFRLALWDEERERLIPFRELRRAGA